MDRDAQRGPCYVDCLKVGRDMDLGDDYRA